MKQIRKEVIAAILSACVLLFAFGCGIRAGAPPASTNSFVWLEQIGYIGYKTSMPENVLSVVVPQTRAEDGTQCERGLSFRLNYGFYDGQLGQMQETQKSYQEISYLLEKRYHTIEGRLCTLTAMKPVSGREQHAVVRMYGDGKLLYTSPPLSSGSSAVPFSVQVSDCNWLKIYVETPNAHLQSGYAYTDIGVVDARLIEKPSLLRMAAQFLSTLFQR